jgi:capsid protein
MPFNVAAAIPRATTTPPVASTIRPISRRSASSKRISKCVVLDRILAAWFDEAVLIPDLLPAGVGPIADWPHQWFWDGHEHVDPAKEATAQRTRLANHTTTLADEYARRGQDWETQLRQRAKELALMTNSDSRWRRLPHDHHPTENPMKPSTKRPAGDA